MDTVMDIKKGIIFVAILGILIFFAVASPGEKKNEMQDGYYTAEAKKFGKTGWKEYITIYVSNNRIITIEFDGKNSSGFIKSWDVDYMRKMNKTDGTYPNKYSREYAEALLNKQNPDRVEAITGATHSHPSFQMLAHAAMQQAKRGDKSVVFVDVETTGDQ